MGSGQRGRVPHACPKSPGSQSLPSVPAQDWFSERRLLCLWMVTLPARRAEHASVLLLRLAPLYQTLPAGLESPLMGFLTLDKVKLKI